jgi:hypothetical protein
MANQKMYELIPKRKLRGHKTFEKIINQVKYADKRFIITERGEELVRLEPVTGREQTTKRRVA